MSIVTVEELTVRGRDERPLLESVSLALEAEETVLLAGPSGSGKTLLGSAVAGLLQDQPGLTRGGSLERNGSVGMLFQTPRRQLVRETVRADVAFGLENRGVEPARIHELIDRWADRLDADPLLDRRVDTLSRGETTLVALLGVLVTQPDLIVLDEPLASLDGANRRRVLAAIDSIQEHTGLLVTEHDVTDLLHRVDRVEILEAGAITDSGSPRSVVASLQETGVKLPFETRVALGREPPPESIPIGGGKP